MLGSWKVILQGDFSGIPFTAFWRHRCAPVMRSYWAIVVHQVMRAHFGSSGVNAGSQIF